MQSFLKECLPAAGLYCTARATREAAGSIEAIPYFIHRWFDTLDQAAAHIEAMDAKGHTMYLAQSAFDPEKVRAAEDFNSSLPKDAPRADRKPVRAQVNVLSIRSFWFDIDCGKEKFEQNPKACYLTQKDAADDLKRFIAETGLPFPSVVSSGNGLYAHWLMDTDLAEQTWKGLAQLLKAVAAAYGFKADPARTSDSASVLRPPGSHNRKRGEVKDVLLLKGSAPISFDTWVTKLGAAAKKQKVDTSALQAPKASSDLNSSFLRGLDGPTPSALIIADKCAQLRQVRDTRGNVDEPLWYAAIGVLKATEEGREIIHQWSAGHPDYSPEATERKIDQHQFPPTSCVHFSSINAHACIGCSYKGKFVSPIVLGRPEPAPLPVVEDDPAPECPAGFRRTATGIWYDDDPAVSIYPYDFYPIRLVADAWLSQENVTFRHKTPHNGWKEFTIGSHLSHDPKQFLMEINKNHVQITGGRERKLFVAFAEEYMKKLRESTRLAQLPTQMGWRDSDKGLCFVLGEKTLYGDGEEETTGLSKNIPDAVRAITVKGETAPWVDITGHLDAPGYEGHAFALLAGAFGAPLLRFTGYSGAMVSMVGRSGRGKSMMEKWILSAYGEYSRLMMLRDDTYNSLISRLAIYGTLPLCLDEVTNIEGINISDLVYRITQGRDKSRLQKNSIEKNNPNQWNTIAVVSSNSSLVDKLSGIKADASAEINRVLEYTLPDHCFDNQAQVCTDIHRTIEDNYGGIGLEYVRYLTANSGKHRANIDIIRADIDKRTKATTEERYWSAVLAVAVYGGLIAQKLGLIKFSVDRVRDWGVQLVLSMRVNKGDAVVSSVSLLASLLDQYAGNCLGVTDSTGKHGCTVVREPRGAIYYRFEMDRKRLYINKAWLKKVLHERFASIQDLKAELKSTKPYSALLNENYRKTLGSGTQFSSMALPCYELDLSVPELGHLGLQLVKSLADDRLGRMEIEAGEGV